MGKKNKIQENISDCPCNARSKLKLHRFVTLTEEEKQATILDSFGNYLPNNGQIIKDQYGIGKYTVLFFDDLKWYNTKYIYINGVKFKPEICFDLPNALGIEAKGEFKGKTMYFVD